MSDSLPKLPNQHTVGSATGISSPDRLFWRHVDMSGGPDACWPYDGAHTEDGYGLVTRGARGHQVTTTASRFAFIDAGGVVGDGEVVDHVVCDNPPCCNPAHLRAVSQQDNILRGTSPSAHAARKTHCKSGHPFDLLNTRRSRQGRRICLACRAVSA